MYGAMAHTADVLMRVIDADASVAMILDGPNQIEVVHIGSRGIDLTSGQYGQLRTWPTDPRSDLWRFMKTTGQCNACLLDPGMPAESERCQEIVRVWRAVGTRIHPVCMSITLSSQPQCHALFVRRRERSLFVQSDLDRTKRFAPQVGRAIQLGHRNELQLLGRTPSTSDPVVTIMPVRDLLDRLSTTENRVLHRLQLLETERQIADALSRSPNTIHAHVKSIYRKLMVNNRKQLIDLLQHQNPRLQNPSSHTQNLVA